MKVIRNNQAGYVPVKGKYPAFFAWKRGNSYEKILYSRSSNWRTPGQIVWLDCRCNSGCVCSRAKGTWKFSRKHIDFVNGIGEYMYIEQKLLGFLHYVLEKSGGVYGNRNYRRW